MDCPSCGHDNPDGAKFCRGCGTSFQSDIACPNCGSRNLPDSAFCNECGQRLADAPGLQAPTATIAASPPKAFVGGRYEVKQLLGEGARKRVYLAHDTRLGRNVAFALIKTEGLDAAGRARVEREARAMARLGDHPH